MSKIDGWALASFRSELKSVRAMEILELKGDSQSTEQSHVLDSLLDRWNEFRQGPSWFAVLLQPYVVMAKL